MADRSEGSAGPEPGDEDAPTFTASRYMTRFRCIGPDCEASCCEGWTIPLDRDHYALTRQAMRATPAGRREFEEKVVPVAGPTRSKTRHALMVMNDDACGFLTPGKLCSLQQRYGEQILSDTCAQFPRSVSRFGARWELSGTPSCPEVARQLLLHDDALERDEVAAELLSRRLPKHQLPARPVAPYARHHDAVRSLVLTMLSDLRFALGARLAMVAWLAERTRPFLHQRAETLDDARLTAELAPFFDLDRRATFARELAGLALPPPVAVRLALAFLVRSSGVRFFEPLRATVLRTHAPSVAGHEVPDADLARVGEEILRSCRERSARFAPFAGRLDRSLTNLAKSFWIRNAYVAAPDLLAHHTELLVLLTVVRLVLLAHPLLAEAEAARGAARDALLDRAVVDAVHRFSRAFEHSAEGLELLRATLQNKQLVTLANAVGLALFPSG